MLNQYSELLCFAAVCSTGSITKAAGALKKSKAHVSRQIKSLEERLGVSLMHRSTRKVSLTDTGRRIEADTLALFNNTQQLIYKAGTLENELAGSFKITMPTSIASSVFGCILKELSALFPKIKFEINVSNKPEDLLMKGIDLAIRIRSVVNENFIAHQVGSYRNIFFTTKNKAKQIKKQEFTELANETILLNSYQYNNKKLELFYNHEWRAIELNKVVMINEYPSLLNYTRQEIGIGFAPDFMLNSQSEQYDLERIYPNFWGQENPVYIAYPFQVPIPNKLSLISQHIRKRLTEILNMNEAAYLNGDFENEAKQNKLTD